MLLKTSVLSYIYAEAEEDLGKYEMTPQGSEWITHDLQRQLEQEREAHHQTRAALEHQTRAAQRANNERQIERAVQAHANLTPKAMRTVTQLMLKGDAGELETDGKGRLREKFGTRPLDELVTDYLRENPHLAGKSDAQSAPAAPEPDRAKMTAKQKADYITEHGQAKYLALPNSKPAK